MVPYSWPIMIQYYEIQIYEYIHNEFEYTKCLELARFLAIYNVEIKRSTDRHVSFLT